MALVKSKYKDPDKYVEKLKLEIDFLRKQRDRLNPTYWFTYKKGTTLSVEFSSGDIAKKVRLLDNLQLSGRVIELKQNDSGKCSAVFAISTVGIFKER